MGRKIFAIAALNGGWCSVRLLIRYIGFRSFPFLYNIFSFSVFLLGSVLGPHKQPNVIAYLPQNYWSQSIQRCALRIQYLVFLFLLQRQKITFYTKHTHTNNSTDMNSNRWVLYRINNAEMAMYSTGERFLRNQNHPKVELIRKRQEIRLRYLLNYA